MFKHLLQSQEFFELHSEMQIWVIFILVMFSTVTTHHGHKGGGKHHQCSSTASSSTTTVSSSTATDNNGAGNIDVRIGQADVTTSTQAGFRFAAAG